MLGRVEFERHSPPARVLFGVLVIETALSVVTLAWELGQRLVDRIKAQT